VTSQKALGEPVSDGTYLQTGFPLKSLTEPHRSQNRMIESISKTKPKPAYGRKQNLYGFDTRRALVEYCVTLYTGGVQQREIARLLGCSRGLVCKLVKHESRPKHRVIRFVK
jgi:hypothetical protein